MKLSILIEKLKAELKKNGDIEILFARESQYDCQTYVYYAPEFKLIEDTDNDGYILYGEYSD